MIDGISLSSVRVKVAVTSSVSTALMVCVPAEVEGTVMEVAKLPLLTVAVLTDMVCRQKKMLTALPPKPVPVTVRVSPTPPVVGATVSFESDPRGGYSGWEPVLVCRWGSQVISLAGWW
jgi:hypothetical protein